MHAVTCMQVQKKHPRSWLRGVRSNQSNPLATGMHHYYIGDQAATVAVAACPLLLLFLLLLLLLYPCYCPCRCPLRNPSAAAWLFLLPLLRAIVIAGRGATRSNFRRGQIEGGARTEGAKRPRIEGEARTEGEARDKAGGGIWGGGSVSPSPENF